MIPILNQFSSGLSLYLDWQNSIGSLIGFLPLLPFLCLGTLYFKNLSRIGKVCLLTSVGLIIARCTLRLIDENQYKMLLLVSYPGSVFLLDLSRVLYDRIFGYSHSWALTISRSVEFLSLLTLITLATTVWHRSRIYQRHPIRAVFHGKNVDLPVEIRPGLQSLQDTFRWLRENTPLQAHIIVWPQNHDKVYLPTLAQRRIVATSPSVFTEVQPLQGRLIAAIENLLTKLRQGEVTRRDYDALFGLKLPWPESIYLMTPRREMLRKDEILQATDLFSNWPAQVDLSYFNANYAVFSIKLLPTARPSRID